MKKYWQSLSTRQKEELAIQIGTTAEYLRQVFVYGRKVGHQMAQKIESNAGIPRHEIRPDIYPPKEYRKVS